MQFRDGLAPSDYPMDLRYGNSRRYLARTTLQQRAGQIGRTSNWVVAPSGPHSLSMLRAATCLPLLRIPLQTWQRTSGLGENLYTNSVVVLDIRTGKLRWYKQLVRNDDHDWDLTQVSPLFRVPVAGHESRVVATAGKDGILRTVDRDSREIVYRTPVTTIKNADVALTAQGVKTCPGLLGGVQWNGPTLNPDLHMLYVGAVDWCMTIWPAPEVRYIPGRLYMGGSWQAEPNSQGWITAVDAATGEVRWRYRSPRPVIAALTGTSGGVIFAGELSGDFMALDARTGKVGFRFNTGGPIGGGIVTYQLSGRQFVAVMSGSPSPLWQNPQNPGAPTVFVFALPQK